MSPDRVMARFGSLVGAAMLTLALGGCAHLIERWYLQEPVPKGASMGVLVNGRNDDLVLATYLEAALSERGGYTIRLLDPTRLMPDDLAGQVRAADRYSFVRSMILQLEHGGSLRGKAAVLEELLDLNDVKDSRTRLSDLLDLVRDTTAALNVEYLMFLTPRQTGWVYTYDFELVRVADRTVMFRDHIISNCLGIRRNIPQASPAKSLRFSVLNPSVRDRLFIDLCQYVAGLVVGGIP